MFVCVNVRICFMSVLMFVLCVCCQYLFTIINLFLHFFSAADFFRELGQ